MSDSAPAPSSQNAFSDISSYSLLKASDYLIVGSPRLLYVPYIRSPVRIAYARIAEVKVRNDMKHRILLLVSLVIMATVAFSQVNLRFKASGHANSDTVKRTAHQSRTAKARHYRSQMGVTSSQPRQMAMAQPLLIQTSTVPIPQFAPLFSVSLDPSHPSNPAFTAVDPFANGLTPSNPLKPPRPFWYSVDKYGLTIMGLRTETTGALMVGGPPINVVANQVVGYVPWPDAIPITQPDGELPADPTIAEDHDKFAWGQAIGGWEPLGITVSYPTDEALASNSETPSTFVFVVMKHSGYEWQSETTLPNGRDPYLRDKIVPSTNPATESSLLVQVDVSQPNYPVDLFPTGAPIGSGLLGHNAGQPAFDAAADGVYVGNMPSTSLPTTPEVPNDLTSFVSIMTLAPGELPIPGEVPAPVTVTVLCGPEHPDIPLLAGVPESWACIAEGGEGPFQWTFTNLPGWLTPHVDPVTGQGDGILYGTPPVGTFTFQAHVDDNATTPPGTGDATVTLLVTDDPATEYEYGELEWEVGAPAAVAIEGTPKGSGNPCALEPTSSPGSMVPAWVDVVQIPGRFINNSAVGGPSENTIGCVVMGTPPISGERYEFQMPNLQFPWPSQNLPILISGQVAGPYMFDSVPAGVTISGLAWHQIDKIHDASTEADLLNREFFGVQPDTGTLYRIVAPYASLEAEGTVVPPPALEGESDEVGIYATSEEMLSALRTARPDIATILDANPNLKVRFGDLVVEANPNPNVYVTAREIFDSTGADPAILPIGGSLGSTVPTGAVIKLSGNRDTEDPAVATLSSIAPIDLPGVQAYYLALDSDLAPAVPGEPGQTDYGVLWATGPNTGSIAIVDTVQAKYTQIMATPGATSLGGVSVYPNTGATYVSAQSLQKVIVFGPGIPPDAAPSIWSASSTMFTVGSLGSFKVTASGSPTPNLSYSGDLPGGVTFTANSDGTATLSGTPDQGVQGSYPITITATNSASPDATQAFTLSINGTAPTITSTNAITFPGGSEGSFTVSATGVPAPSLSYAGTLPSGLIFTDNGNGTATLAGTTDAAGTHTFTINATNGVLPEASQQFTMTVSTAKASMLTPAQGSVLAGSAATFTWGGGAGVSNYYLWIGTADGAHDLKNIALPASTTTYTETNLPTAGAMLYVRLYSLINGAYEYNSYTYVAASQIKAAMISPVADSTLTGSTVTFTWGGGAGVSSYYLWIGTTEGARNVKNIALASDVNSYTATGLPTNGGPLYVRLYSLINGVNQYNNYAYTQATQAKAMITSPANGSTLAGSTVTFTWDGAVGATSYYLWIGTTEGARDLKNVSLQPGVTSYVASGLPTDGKPLYVRLYTQINGTNQYNSYAYTAASIMKAEMISPVNESHLAGSTITFTWGNGAGVTNYYLWIGTAEGSSNLKNVTLGPGSTSYVATGLPTNGTALYVRLYSRINGVNQYNSYVYTAANHAKAAIIDPADGGILPGSTATFTWAGGAGVTNYYLWIGTTDGSNNLLNVRLSPSVSSYTVTGLPTNGGALYVRLYSLINGVYQYNSYTYVEAAN